MKIELLHKSRKKRGAILVLTLWMVTVLSLIAYSLAYEMMLESRLTKLQKDNLVAYQLAKAGLARAICDLKNDMLVDRDENAQVFDAEGDIWMKPEGKMEVEMLGGTYTVRVIDEERYVNLNQAHPALLKNLIIVFVGDDEEEEADKTAQAIADWRDPDDKPSTIINVEGQSEREVYQRIIAEDSGYSGEDWEEFDYRQKNDYFTTVEELMNVYGMDIELFYGYDPVEERHKIYAERAMSGREENSHIMTAGSNDDNSYFLQVRGFRDVLTVNSSGLLNINTAGEEVLTALLITARVDEDAAEETARSIISYRRNGSDDDIDNDQAFRAVGDLAQVDGVSGAVISRMQSIQRLTTVSSNFRIIAEGRSGRAHRTIEAVVMRTWETFNIDANDGDFDENVRRRIRREDDDSDSSRVTVEDPTVRIFQWRER